MSSSADATGNGAVVQEGIDFASAKNFWQTRAARAQSNSDLVGLEGPIEGRTSRSQSSSDLSSLESLRTTTTNTTLPPVPSTPTEQYPGEPEEEKAKEPSPSPSPPPPTSAPTTLTRMTSLRSKFFGGTTSNEQKETDTSPNGSMSTLSVPQMPDMSAWKDRMKMGQAKMSFSFKDLSSTLKTSLSSAASLAGADPEKVAMARNNIQRPTLKNTRKVSGAATTADANAFGELIVAEILAAKDLAAADFFQGESDPYIIVRFREWERRTAIVQGTKSPVFNERFVFWIPSPSPSTSSDTPKEPELVSIVVMNKNKVMSDMHLGEVHISLDVPLNEAFDEWYPLVKENGEQQGHVRVGVRRMELTSTTLQEAAQALASNDRSLNDEDLTAYGSVLPDLWYGFAEAAEPLEEKASQADVLATKLNDLSRRFIGIELTSTELTSDGKRRDIF